MILAPPILVVDRAAFRLTLWKPSRTGYVPKRRYRIAVGQVGHETPAGMYRVETKTRTPDWRAPDSEWVQPPEMRGQVFSFDDMRNPFAGGFISISIADGVGIHGTKFPPHVGEAVSHGCVRMETDEFVRLYRLVPVGTPVFVY